MCNDGSLSKQTVAVLDKYIQYHHLKSHPLEKEKLIEVQRHIINNLTNSATQQEQFDSGNELKEPAFFHQRMKIKMRRWILYLAEIGSSSSEGEEESDENDYNNSSRVATSTRSGRRATRFLL